MNAICVVGSFMMDMRVAAPRFPSPGETVIGTEFSTIVGGKGFNQAVAAARAGATVSMIGAVGEDDFGKSFLAELTAEGIKSTGVAQIHGERTGVGMPIVISSGENSIIVVPQANERLTAKHVEANAAQIASAKVLLLQLENPVPAVLRAAEIANEAGTRVILNPAPYAEIPTRLIENVDILVPNESELSALAGLGEKEQSLTDLERIGLKIHNETGCELAITAGARGAISIEKGARISRVPACETTVVDTVGAGDTFCGNLAVKIAEGETIANASLFANAAASIAVSRSGSAAATPHRSEVEVLMKEADTV